MVFGPVKSMHPEVLFWDLAELEELWKRRPDNKKN